MALPSITVRPEKTIGSFTSKWNAGHNPIVYKISNDKWPVNTLDAAENITAHADNGGNVQFTIAGHSFVALQWVTIAASTITSYNGVWKILAIDTNDITLDLPYEAGTLGSPTALRYYQNYHNLIQVYVGIPVGHARAAEDPIAFQATQRSIPGLTNIALVDVSDILKDKLFMLNEPDDNDINLWTAFYIYHAESYDDVVTGEIIQFISEYADDSANIFYATEAKLPFQNPYGSNIGAWVVGTNNAGSFLTKFEQPVMWLDKYFDLSAILDSNEATAATLDYTEYDSGGNSLGTTQIALVDEDAGVYRTRMDNLTYNDLTAYLVAKINASTDSEELRIDLGLECERQSIYLCWLNHLGGFDYWNFTAQSEYGVDIEADETFEKNIFADWDTSFISGETVKSFNKIDARNSVTVRSQLLTREQVEGIANVRISPLVQQIRTDGTKITVLVDKSGFKIREDGQKLYSIEFGLVYTDNLPIQNA